MVRAVLLGFLFVTAARADDDPHVARYKLFFREDIAAQWAAEALSDQRVVMVRGFAKHDVPDAARWLISEVLVKERAADVVREAVRILAGYKNPDTIAGMATLFEKKLKKSWEARTLLLHAFGKIKLDTATRPIRLGLADRDARVYAAACRAAGAGKRIKLRGALEKALKHKHRAVRGAALAALADLGGEASLPLVFRLFCVDPSPRVRYDAWLALRKLTLDEERPCDPDAWRDFWTERSREIEEGQPNPWGTSFPRVNAKTGRPGPFFAIPVLGDRVCFVIDTTRDMNSPWRIDHQTERKKPKAEQIPGFFSVKTRWDLVKSYLKDCLKKAPESMGFAVVFWNEKPFPWPENGKFLKNSSRNRAKLFKHLDEGVELASITAMYEGLAAGWGLLKGGDPAKNFDRGADTIVFLTDGRPTHGELKDRPERLLDECWRIAVTRQLRFHTVGLYNHQFDLLKGMAKVGGGLYVHVQPSGDPAEPQDLDFWPKKKKAFEEAQKAKKRG